MPVAPIAAPPQSSLPADVIADAVEASSKLVLLIERCGKRPDQFLIRGANAAFLTAAGYAEPELLARPLTFLAAAPALPPDLLAAFGAGAAQRTEMVCRGRDGRSFWFGLHVVPVPRAGRDHFALLGRDITHQHRQAEEHNAIEGLLTKVFLSIAAGVIIVGTDGVVLMANPCIHRLLHLPADAMVGHNSLEFVVPGDRDRLAAARERQLVEGGDYTVPLTLLAADGTEVPVSLTAAMVVARAELSRFRVLTVIPAGPTAMVPANARPPPPPLRVQIAGNIQLVGLEEVRASLGDDWPRHAARVMDTAEHVLKQRCGRQDRFARSGPCGFVVCFAGASEQEAAFRAAMIARDIRHRLVGNSEPEEASHVTAVTASVSVPGPELPAGDPPELRAELSEMLARELNRRAGELEGAARACLAQAVRQESCVIEPVHSRGALQTPARILRLAPASEHRIAAALAALPEQEAAAFDLDGFLLDKAVIEAARLAMQFDPSRVFVDVRFSALTARPRLERYLAHCRQIRPPLRKGLMLVLTEIPSGVSASRLVDCANSLKPFCAGLGFQADVLTLTLPFAELSFTGVPVIVVPAEACGASGVVLPKVRRLIATAHIHRGRVLVRGLANWSAAEPLLAAGVDFVSLAGVAGPAPMP